MEIQSILMYLIVGIAFVLAVRTAYKAFKNNDPGKFCPGCDGGCGHDDEEKDHN